MTPSGPVPWWSVLCFLLLLSLSAHGAVPEPAPIPESEITALETELAQGTKGASVVDIRRACKRVARQASALLEASPEARNRFVVLAILFKGQKRLLALEATDRNREALFKTCSELAEAPDDYAGHRLEADLLLSEKALAEKNATVAERVKALEMLIERYRGTPAESRSLMIGALIAARLQAFNLKETILTTMRDRLAGDHELIRWRRKHAARGQLEVIFSGTYDRVDDVPLHFPVDRMGHLCLMVFWSQETRGYEKYLKQIKELRVQYPDRFDVFSFNLDELQDGGTAALRKLELEWTVMRLPGGKSHPAFRTYASGDPCAIFVNAYGRALLPPHQSNTTFSLSGNRITGERILAQLQSLFVGDYLVESGGWQVAGGRERAPSSHPGPALKAMQDCFIPPPLRYRLVRQEALSHYQKAEALCADAMKKAPKAADLQDVRNRRIIALLGMWNLACEPRYLEQAVAEAKASLAATLPRGADVVPRFCLAKAALRKGEGGESVLPAFVEATGGSRAPASALAAAAMLALDAGSRDLHERYRARLLAIPNSSRPSLWPVISFLRDRIHTYGLLRGNYVWHTRQRERPSIRSHIINLGGAPTTNRLPAITVKALDGSTLSLPRDTNGRLTLLLFVEPSGEPNAEFPIDGGADYEKKKSPQHSVLGYACNLANQHVNKELNTIAAFLSDDAGRIDALMKPRELSCQVAMVPGGITNRMVRQLGILSADRIPNIFLLRRDGTIAWHASGLPYADCEEWVDFLAMKLQVEVCEVEHGYKALTQSDFETAARTFAGPFRRAEPDRHRWRAPRHHGRALALMGSKDWEAALEAIDTAIDAHRLPHVYGKNRWLSDWRSYVSQFPIDQPCETVSQLWQTKIAVLNQLGRDDEAAVLRERRRGAIKKCRREPYASFHDKLEAWRVSHQETAKHP